MFLLLPSLLFINDAFALILTALGGDHHHLHLFLSSAVLVLYHLAHMIMPLLMRRRVRSESSLRDYSLCCARVELHLSVLI